MRAGGCTMQQALTPEAAALVKQSVSLARRRGHAQVTPLHVASTMLSSSVGLLRAACLQSHSHPLQCKALELCFNVALNRLPASTATSPMLGHTHHRHHHPPTLSNALVAAFKRAQAHQRRGTIETQQQPLLAVKIEVEQLVISILDDPSVSRVMREAGFSSTQVKTNVERAVSLEMCSSPSLPSSANPEKAMELGFQLIDTSPTQLEPTGGMNMMHASSICRSSVEHQEARHEDVMSVVECLIGRKKRSCVVVVGESLSTAEGVVRGLMDKAERGEVPEILKSVQFISFPLFSFAHLTKDEVEQKVGDLRCLVKSCCVGRGAVLYLGDLKWAAEYRASCGDKSRSFYCPVEHVIMELGRMVCGGGFGESSLGGRFWFMGVATYQTYMKCRVGYPSLETLWALHPHTVPAGSLGLSLSHDHRNGDGVGNKLINFCDDSTKSETAIQSRQSSNLPPWLQNFKENKPSCHEQRPQGWSPPLQGKHPRKENCFWISYTSFDEEGSEPNSRISCSSKEHKKPTSAFLDLGVHNPKKSSPVVSTSSSGQSMEMEYYHHKFKELNAENLKTLCYSLEKKVPWQMDIIPEIASIILQCRSGMIRKKDSTGANTNWRTKEDTWMFFQGCDVEGKKKISRELAGLVFGSNSCSVSIGLSRLSSTKSDSSDDLGNNKRSRSEATYLERFTEAVGDNPHRVFLLEDMEQVDYRSLVGIKKAIERGVVHAGSIIGEGEEEHQVGLEDAIVILSCESFDSRSRACSPSRKQNNSDCVHDGQKVDEDKKETMISSCLSLDLNLSACDDEDLMDDDEQTIDDVGLIESVDRSFFFQLRED